MDDCAHVTARADVWSAREYAGHLLVVCRMQHERISLAMVVDTPGFTPIPVNERTAEGRFNELDITEIRRELNMLIDTLADHFHVA